jgi:hypothetical protein
MLKKVNFFCFNWKSLVLFHFKLFWYLFTFQFFVWTYNSIHFIYSSSFTAFNCSDYPNFTTFLLFFSVLGFVLFIPLSFVYFYLILLRFFCGFLFCCLLLSFFLEWSYFIGFPMESSIFFVKTRELAGCEIAESIFLPQHHCVVVSFNLDKIIFLYISSLIFFLYRIGIYNNAYYMVIISFEFFFSCTYSKVLYNIFIVFFK